MTFAGREYQCYTNDHAKVIETLCISPDFPPPVAFAHLLFMCL